MAEQNSGSDAERETPYPSEIAQALDIRISRFPSGRDSVRGIAEWWLPDIFPRPSDQQVLAALEWLEGEGKVLRTLNPDGTIVWGASPANRTS